MKRMLLAVGVGLVLCCPWALAGDKEFAYIDLQPKANHKLTDPFHSGSEGNDLSDLPKGEQVFAKVKFKVGDGLIQLGSKRTKDLPDMVEGIEVNRSFVRLHLLHATGYGAYGNEGDELFVADDTPIGEYKIHYADKTTATIPIVYGKDVRDWWDWDKSKAVTRGKLGWEGTNDFAKKFDVKIRLYVTTWENPHPEKRVARIDYLRTGESVCAPFCVAMSTEGTKK
jgi:hypothetical protein